MLGTRQGLKVCACSCRGITFVIALFETICAEFDPKLGTYVPTSTTSESRSSTHIIKAISMNIHFLPDNVAHL